MTRSYYLPEEEITLEPYHYTQCGLDDVYLLNGYKRHETPYGNGVSVENVYGLYDAIAESLCKNKALLGGKEIRFLRKQMDLTQADVALRLGCDSQSVARWEKGKSEINGAADRLLRLLYLGTKNANIDPVEVIRALARLDAKISDKQIFEETDSGWKTAA